MPRTFYNEILEKEVAYPTNTVGMITLIEQRPYYWCHIHDTKLRDSLIACNQCFLDSCEAIADVSEGAIAKVVTEFNAKLDSLECRIAELENKEL